MFDMSYTRIILYSCIRVNWKFIFVSFYYRYRADLFGFHQVILRLPRSTVFRKGIVLDIFIFEKTTISK